MDPGSDIGDFAYLLAEWIRKKGLNPTQFARLLGYKNSGAVFLVLQGKKPLPLNDLEKWLNILALSESEKTRMRRKAYEAYAPRYVLQLVNQMRFENRAWMNAVKGELEKRGLRVPPIPDVFGDAADEMTPRRRVDPKPPPAN